MCAWENNTHTTGECQKLFNFLLLYQELFRSRNTSCSWDKWPWVWIMSTIDFLYCHLICIFLEKLQPVWEHARDLPSVWAPLLPQHRVRLHVLNMFELWCEKPLTHKDMRFAVQADVCVRYSVFKKHLWSFGIVFAVIWKCNWISGPKLLNTIKCSRSLVPFINTWRTAEEWECHGDSLLALICSPPLDGLKNPSYTAVD